MLNKILLINLKRTINYPNNKKKQNKRVTLLDFQLSDITCDFKSKYLYERQAFLHLLRVYMFVYDLFLYNVVILTNWKIKIIIPFLYFL